MRLSFALGVPQRQLKRVLSSRDWTEYQAADRVGLVPDWRRQQEIMAVAGNLDPAKLFDDEQQPQDMAEVYQQRKAAYGPISAGNPGIGPANKPLDSYLTELDAKLKRGVMRKMVAAGGSQLAKEIREQIKKRDMPYSRGRNAAERRKARQAGTKPLIRTIAVRRWSKPQKGLLGAVVGPAWPTGAHGHLVERGHRITGHKVGRTQGRRRIFGSGNRTRAHLFQAEANARAAGRIYNGMYRAMVKALHRIH